MRHWELARKLWSLVLCLPRTDGGAYYIILNAGRLVSNSRDTALTSPDVRLSQTRKTDEMQLNFHSSINLFNYSIYYFNYMS